MTDDPGYAAFYRHMRSEGRRGPQDKRTRNELAELIRHARSEGLSWRQTGARLGANYERCRLIAKEYGIP